MRRLFEPAFGERNRNLSFWIIKINLSLLAFFYVMFPEDVMIHNDLNQGLAIAKSKLRDEAWKRMGEACFTRREIKHYWYDQGFWEYPNRLLVIVRGREKLCGGRGSCGCNVEGKGKGSV